MKWQLNGGMELCSTLANKQFFHYKNCERVTRYAIFGLSAKTDTKHLTVPFSTKKASKISQNASIRWQHKFYSSKMTVSRIKITEMDCLP